MTESRPSPSLQDTRFGISIVAALLGKQRISKATPPLPEQAVADVKADVEEIKERAHR